MALSTQFSLLNSELNDFLFAQIGEEKSGAPLSVLSALTRLGVDPWAEGARLSGLPKDVAARALTLTIAMFPTEERTSSEVLNLAERLAALLPRHAPDPAAPTPASSGHQRIDLSGLQFWLGLFLILASLAAYKLLSGQ